MLCSTFLAWWLRTPAQQAGGSAVCVYVRGVQQGGCNTKKKQNKTSRRTIPRLRLLRPGCQVVDAEHVGLALHQEELLSPLASALCCSRSGCRCRCAAGPRLPAAAAAASGFPLPLCCWLMLHILLVLVCICSRLLGGCGGSCAPLQSGREGCALG